MKYSSVDAKNTESRKAFNRRLVKAKNKAEQSAVAVESRIKLLAAEETKM